MTEFVKANKYLVGFIGTLILINLSFGDTATFYFLLLVLLSMIVVNSDKINSFIGGLKV